MFTMKKFFAFLILQILYHNFNCFKGKIFIIKGIKSKEIILKYKNKSIYFHLLLNILLYQFLILEYNSHYVFQLYNIFFQCFFSSKELKYHPIKGYLNFSLMNLYFKFYYFVT